MGVRYQRAITKTAALAGLLSCLSCAGSFLTYISNGTAAYPSVAAAQRVEQSASDLNAQGYICIGWVYSRSSGGSLDGVTERAMTWAAIHGAERVILHNASGTKREQVFSPGVPMVSIPIGTIGNLPVVYAPGPTRYEERQQWRIIAELFRYAPDAARALPNTEPPYARRVRIAQQACINRDLRFCGGFMSTRHLSISNERACLAGDGWACRSAARENAPGANRGRNYTKFQEYSRHGCDLGVADACSDLTTDTRIDGYEPLPESERNRFYARAENLRTQLCYAGDLNQCWQGRVLPAATFEEYLSRACREGLFEYCDTLADRLISSDRSTSDRARGRALFAESCARGSPRGCEAVGWSNLNREKALRALVQICIKGFECETLEEQASR